MNWINVFNGYPGVKLNNWQSIDVNNPIIFRQNSEYFIKDSVFLVEKTAINYVEKSIENGTIAVVTDQDIETSLPVYKVDNLSNFIKTMTQDLLKNSKFTIGITGSVGKTTFTRNLSFYLNGFMPINTNFRNFNSIVGLPVNILSTEFQGIYCYEMGISHPGDMTQLTTIYSPQLAVCLPVKHSHSENFTDLNHLKNEKFQIFKTAQYGISPQQYHDEILSINPSIKLYSLEQFYFFVENLLEEDNYNKFIESVGNFILDLIMKKR